MTAMRSWPSIRPNRRWRWMRRWMRWNRPTRAPPRSSSCVISRAWAWSRSPKRWGWRAAPSIATGASRAPSSNRTWLDIARRKRRADGVYCQTHETSIIEIVTPAFAGMTSQEFRPLQFETGSRSNRELRVEATPTLRDLFEEALKLPPDARARLLAEGCADPSMRAELERMLMADAEEGEWLAAGDAASAAQTIGETEAVEPLPPGSRIGPFELLEVLGEGGSSTVFRGCRDVEGVRQFVAVKLLARGLYTAEARRRFHHEREALARLRHPGIARLIEGGVADNGLAYIALELVEGVPITTYVQEHALSERQRLALFLRVCRAVESAHRALIVHRDLKPSNVLVTTDGEMKLLDFGIAKLLDDTEDATRTRHQALTPAYAAPEQFTPGAITTATDVYALGVLLRELLTGERNASTDARTRTANAQAAAQARPKHLRNLRGDLANIVAKATAPEPERRYGSGGALAEDIERYLDCLPVRAHPPSRWYRTGWFVARHRGGVAVTAVLVLAILASLSIALWQAHVARQQAQRANAIRDFVVDLLRKTAPDVAASQRPDVPTLVYTAANALPL